MLKIRLQRIGRRNNPSYRVVVVDSTVAVRKGKPVELLGTHDTVRKKTSLDSERILYWMSQGAQVSDTMHNILIKNGVIEGVKVNVLPKKSPVKKEEESDAVSEVGADTLQDGNDTPKAVDAPEERFEKKEEPSADKPSQDSSQEQQLPTTPSAEG